MTLWATLVLQRRDIFVLPIRQVVESNLRPLLRTPNSLPALQTGLSAPPTVIIPHITHPTAVHVVMLTLFLYSCLLTFLKQNGFVFRIRIFNPREIQLCKQPNGSETTSMRKRLDQIGKELDIEMVKKPLHTTMVHRLVQICGS